MAMPKSLAIVAMLVGSTSLAFAQGAGIAPNGRNLPPQSYYGLNGTPGYDGYYNYAPGYGYYGLYNYAPGYYYGYRYARPYWGYRYHWR